MNKLHRRGRQAGCLLRVIIEAIEPRLLLSASADIEPIVTPAPMLVVQAGMATPYGSSTPTGAPSTPAKMRSAYGLGTYGSSNITFNGVQGDGSGQTIALIAGGNDPNIASDLASFDSYWDLPAPPSFQVLNQSGSPTGLPAVGDVGETALDVEWAHVMAPGASLIVFEGSLYTCMTTAKSWTGVSVISISYGISGTQADSFFDTPSGHTGVTFVASTGDTGGTVVEPSKSASVVAAGGTDLNLSGSNWSSETAWSSGGGGINTADTQPAYQNGVVSVWSTTNRTTPDISMDADPSTGVAVYDSYTNGTSKPWSEIVGGTSLSSPLVAGVIAVADQGRVAAGLTPMDGFTQTLPRLYSLTSADFHDITSGNNTHAATAGYDLASGIGSPIANKLIPDLAGADTITGRAFIDSNGNGTYDGSDTALSGKTVYLDLNDNGIQDSDEPTATTNSSGIYTFSDQIGSETGVVRLASPPAGDLSGSVLGTFTTSYDQTQTINLPFYPSAYAAVATPSTVTSSTALSVSGASPSDVSSFTFTWSVTTLPSGASAPTISPNGTSAAQNAAATFSHTGTYVFKLTITDTFGLSVASNVTVVVRPAPATITAVGGFSAIATGATLQFDLTDQFGNAITSGVTWMVTGGGTISSSGLFTAGQIGGSYTVSATNGTSVSTNITVVPTSYTAAAGASDFVVRISPDDSSTEQIWINTAETNTPTWSIGLAQLPLLSFVATAGGGSVIIDYANGNPVPAGGITFTGGGAGNALFINGASAGGLAFSVGAQSFTSTAAPAATVGFSGVQILEFDLLGGSNSLTQTATPSAALIFNAGAGNNTLTINGGSFSFTSDPQIASGNLTVNDNSTVTFTAGATGSGINARNLAGLSVGAGATATVANPSANSDRTVLVLGALSIASTGHLAMGANDIIVHTGNIAAITALVTSGQNGGQWNGPGIDSSAAAGDPTHLASIGAIINLNGSSTVYSTFDNQPVIATDVLIKYTILGDANLDGTVDGSDYTLTDNGFNTHLTGWLNGDFNYDGAVNGSDYTLIDNAFNTQSASMSVAASANELTLGSPAAADATASASPASSSRSSPAVFSSIPLRKHKHAMLDITAIAGHGDILT